MMRSAFTVAAAALSPFVGVRWGICAVKCLYSFAVYTFQLKFLFAQIA